MREHSPFPTQNTCGYTGNPTEASVYYWAADSILAYACTSQDGGRTAEFVDFLVNLYFYLGVPQLLTDSLDKKH